MTIEPAARPRAVRKPLSASSLALLCSICINAAFASYLAIQALAPVSVSRPVPQLNRDDGNPDSLISRVADLLPSHDGEILRQAYQAKETQILAANAAARGARLRALTLLAQRDIDSIALQAVFNEAMDNRMRARKLLSEAMLEALLRMSPEARMQISSFFQR